MDVNKAEVMAEDLIGYWLGEEWGFTWNSRNRAIGVCSNRFKKIAISINYAMTDKEDMVLDTICHEIAHGLAGPEAGHGPLWTAWCLKVGANPVSRKRIEHGQKNHKYELYCTVGQYLKDTFIWEEIM